MFLQFLNNVRETRTNICPSIISALASHSQNVLPRALSWKLRIKYRIDYTSTLTRRNLVPVRTSRLWFFLLPGTFYKLNYRRVSGKKYSFALLCVELPPTYSFELLDTFISLSLITMRKEWTNHCNEEIKKTLNVKTTYGAKMKVSVRSKGRLLYSYEGLVLTSI